MTIGLTANAIREDCSLCDGVAHLKRFTRPPTGTLHWSNRKGAGPIKPPKSGPQHLHERQPASQSSTIQRGRPTVIQPKRGFAHLRMGQPARQIHRQRRLSCFASRRRRQLAKLLNHPGDAQRPGIGSRSEPGRHQLVDRTLRPLTLSHADAIRSRAPGCQGAGCHRRPVPRPPEPRPAPAPGLTSAGGGATLPEPPPDGSPVNRPGRGTVGAGGDVPAGFFFFGGDTRSAGSSSISFGLPGGVGGGGGGANDPPWLVHKTCALFRA